MPKVSVVIPAFNAAATIGETLDSIRAQQGVDFEIIVVDDGSSDATAAIARLHAPDAIIIQQANSGRGTARNVGVERASGEYVYFFDSDDLMEPHAILRLASWLDCHPECDVAFGDTLVFSGNPSSATLRSPRCTDSGTLLHRHLAQPFMTMITSMFRRPLYARVGGMSPGLKSNEDWHFWLKLSVMGAVFDPIGDPPLARYRTYTHARGSSLVHPHSAVQALKMFKAEFSDRLPSDLNIDRCIAKARSDYARSLLRAGEKWSAWREWIVSLRHSRENFLANAFVFVVAICVSAQRAERMLAFLVRMRWRLRRPRVTVF
jgi:glycosyltransferase involved in cell wall biosynthesis